MSLQTQVAFSGGSPEKKFVRCEERQVRSKQGSSTQMIIWISSRILTKNSGSRVITQISGDPSIAV